MIYSPHLPIQLLVLGILDEALKFVRNFDDQLLPMIHQNWHGLVRKFEMKLKDDVGVARETQWRVAAEALKVVNTMCELSGLFVYRKVVDELTPKLCELMREAMKRIVPHNRCYSQAASYHFLLVAVER